MEQNILKLSSINSGNLYGQQSGFKLSTLAEDFIRENPTVFYSTNLNSIVEYSPDQGCYREINYEQFASRVQDYLEKKSVDVTSASQVDSLAKYISRKSNFRKDVKFNTERYKFAVRNCIIDTTDGIIKILPHTADFYTTTSFDVEYNPQITSDVFLRVLKEILPEKSKQVYLLDWMAYLLLRTYEHQKILVLYGNGRNGKRTIFETLYAIIGEQHISSFSTHQLSHNRFMLSNLKDKYVNISTEQKFGVLEQDVLKQLSGEDLITAERKFQADSVKFYNSARLIISTNILPELKEFNTSVTARYEILRFSNSFGDSPDTSLTKKLISEREKSALLNLLLNYHIPRILKKGAVYIETPEIVKNDTKLFFEGISEVSEFVEDRCVLGDSKYKVKLQDIYSAYMHYCRKNGIKNLLSKKQFTERIQQVYNIRKANGAQNKTYLYGISLETDLEYLT